MAVLPGITSQYAKAVIVDHTRTYDSVPESYKEPVKQFAADRYYIEELDGAVMFGTLPQDVRDAIIALKDPSDPQQAAESTI
jgi:hypothetical protein